MFTEIDDRNGGKRHITQSPYHFSDAVSGVRGTVAFRGEHYTEVLTEWLGLSDQEISDLRAEDILLYDPDWHI